MDNANSRYLEAFYRNEYLHMSVYNAMAKSEKNHALKEILIKLTSLEQKDMNLCSRIIDTRSIRLSKVRTAVAVLLIKTMKSLLGLAITVKMLKYQEFAIHSKLRYLVDNFKTGSREARLIRQIENNVMVDEEKLERRIITEHSPGLDHIRDVIFGMYDGLVEVFAATAGLAIAIHNPTLVLFGGLIFAMSGTLSMSGSAYLSAEYENSISRTRRISPKRAAAYAGVLYVVGAIFPLMPYIFGIVGYFGILLSIIATAAALTVVSALISIVSNTGMKSRIVKSLLISLGIAMVTMAIGVFAHDVLHVT